MTERHGPARTMSGARTAAAVIAASLLVAGAVPAGAGAVERAPVSTERSTSTTQISQQNLVFHPFEITIGSGDTVVWTNNETDETIHSVVQRGGSEINSPDMAAGEVFEWTFVETGTYDIVCRFHPDMFMTVEVAAAGAGKGKAKGKGKGAKGEQKGAKQAGKTAGKKAGKKAGSRNQAHEPAAEHDFSAHNDPGSEPAAAPGPPDSTIPGIAGLPFAPDRESHPMHDRNQGS